MMLWALLGCPPVEKDTGGTTTTDPVNYSDELQFIFDRNCVTSGCHGPPEPEQGMDLSAAVSHANLVDAPSTQVPTMDRIEPGDPDASYFMYKIQDRQAEVGGTGTRMPTELFLAEPDIEMFRNWILAGAPND